MGLEAGATPLGMMQTALAASAITNVVTTGAATISNIQASRAQADYERRTSLINERMEAADAEDARRRGELEAHAIRRRAQQILGSQRVAGAGPELLEETSLLGALDVIEARENAFRESQGARLRGLGYASQRRLGGLAARTQQRMTLLSGATSIGREIGSYAVDYERLKLGGEKG